MMKRTLPQYSALIISLFLSIQLNAQKNEWPTAIQEVADGWYQINEEGTYTASEFLDLLKEAEGLDASHNFQLFEAKNDELGFEHRRYQQYYKGVPVEGGEIILHLYQGELRTANGELVKNLSLDVSPTISKADAINAAKEHMGADVYMWEEEDKHALSHVEDFKPKPELFIASPAFNNQGSSYGLTWKMDLFAAEPMDRQWVYVNANTGKIALSLSRIHHASDTGTARTKYYGIQQIVTDSVNANQWRLVDNITGGGIETLDLNQGNRSSLNAAVDFTDSNNYWDNFNAQYDEVATDAHFGTNSTYHYFLDQHGRNSYDDADSRLYSLVHYRTNYVNAFWNGSWMTYGDGDGNSYKPLTSLDVIAHEITHGVTSNSSRLIYWSESGALNESFSDIFGAAVEYEYDSAGFDWLIGEDFMKSKAGFRDMANPNAQGDPKNYQGIDWGYSLYTDNGWLHKNSGVQNHWFYLLSEGKKGTNDFGQEYEVQKIGIRKAAKVAYRTNNFYLTRTSVYADARMASIQAARDIYGACSNEEVQVTNAWYAVGVGSSTGERDVVLEGLSLQPVSCGLGTNETLSVAFSNGSCNYTIPAGDTIAFQYILNSTDSAIENLVLAQAMPVGAQDTFRFNTGLDLSAITTHRIKVRAIYGPDRSNFNDVIDNYRVENRAANSVDFDLVRVVSPATACDLGDSLDLELAVVYFGCNPLPSGSTINIDYEVNLGGLQSGSYTTAQTANYGDTIVASLANAIVGAGKGTQRIDARINEPTDIDASNDRIFNYTFSNTYPALEEVLSFESFNYGDTVILRSEKDAYIKQGREGSIGLRALEFHGGNTPNYVGQYEPYLNAGNVWQENESFSSEVALCIDASDYGTLFLDFDLRQEYSTLFDELVDTSGRSGSYTYRETPYSSAFRVKVNGQQVSQTFIPTSTSGDPFQTHTLDLSAYAGSEFQLVFEGRMLTDGRTNNVTNDEDLAILDNIRLSGSQIGLPETPWQKLSVYPNPNQGSFTLDLGQAVKERLQVNLLDATGKVIRSMEKDPQGASALYLEMTDLPTGLYLLEVKSSEGLKASQRLIIE